MSHIHLSQVNLHYSSLAYNETSLKAFIFKLLKFKYRKPLSNIHALKDINLEIKAGERVVLLGHNGAGKSTLLKTISGLYPISSGKCQVKGKIRSLFELNLGFEPDATGRENILYRGLFLGQTPSQMQKLTDEIIEFANIGEFIDYPLKTYSAGMQVRLAFAISTAIPGDLLLLDEVVGAGDAEFMQKSRDRLKSLMHNAEIVILASHDLSSARSLCTRGIVLHHGAVAFDGEVEAAIASYQRLMHLSPPEVAEKGDK